MPYLDRVLDESSKGKGVVHLRFDLLMGLLGSVSIELMIPGKVVKDQGLLWHCLTIPSNPVIFKTF